MADPVRSVIVVGGGTAGWMAALSMQRRLASLQGSRVTVVESPRLPSIGVGESTLPHIRQTLSSLGLEESEFMRRTGATFKVALKFVNWKDSSPGDFFWSPFPPFPPPSRLANLIGYHLGLAPNAHADVFGGSQFHSIELAELGKAPKFGTEQHYKGQVQYAYHLDAGLFAEFLKEKAL